MSEKELLDRIAELETLLQSEKRQVENVESVHWITEQGLKLKIARLEAELAKRPVVYCARNRNTDRMLTLGGFVVLLHPAQRCAWEDAEWTTEIYTGEQL